MQDLVHKHGSSRLPQYAAGFVSRCRGVAAFLLVVFAGCAGYRPMPLTPTTATRHLAPPDLEVISVQARSIVHPILRPIEFDASDGLSPDEAAIFAVLANPALRAERGRRGTACAQLLQAGLLPNPQLTYSMDFPTGGATAGTINAFGLGLNWDVSSLVSHAARVDAAAMKPRMVVLDIAWKEWQAAENAKIAAYRRTSLVRQVELAREMDKRLLENLQVIRKAVKEGLKTELDLSAAETASNQAHTNLVNLQKQADEERLALNLAIGLPAEAETTVQQDTKLPDQLTPPSPDQLLACLEKRRLDLIALRYGYESQEATVRAAVLEQFPRISFGPTYARDNTDVISTGFGLTVDLPVFDHNQGHIAEELATRQTLFDEYVSRVFQARSDVVHALTETRWIDLQIKTAEETVPSLQRLVETYRLAIDKGQADVLSYYTAWNSLTQQRIEIVKLKQQLAEARISLELATGLYCVGSALPSEPEAIPSPQAEKAASQP
jgi:cobalt-zinc-cadmium efflux system outer membrane protein